MNGLPKEASEYIESLERQVERLTELLRLSQKARFGASSEKAKYVLADGAEQVCIFNEAEAVADETAAEPVIVERHTRKKKRTKEELAKTLPVKEVMIELPENERVCGICEGELTPIGKELVRRELSIIPAQAYVTETYRVNYACRQCQDETDEANIVKAPVPEPVIKRGLASPSAIAHVIYQKYVNSIPLDRQEKDWARFGVNISRATLANWIIYVCKNWLIPLWFALKVVLLQSLVICSDDTVTQVLMEPGKTPQSESRMWVYCTGNTGGPVVILYEYQPNRSGENPKKFLEGAKNYYLQTDGYAGYNSVEGATHCGCWAHLRRKFEEALPPQAAKKDSKAAEGLAYCQQLFMLERKSENMPPEERLKSRLEKSKPVLDAYFAWIETVNPLQGSKLAAAITYSRNQREPLTAFLLDGHIEIFNNRIENHIRPFTLGRKNWLFADTVRGAQSSAVAYSIIETAKANGLNPYKYLLYLFTKLPSVLTKNPNADLSAFFPWNEAVRAECGL